MSQINNLYFLLLITLFAISQATQLGAVHRQLGLDRYSHRRSRSRILSFVEAQCRGTRYPQLCVRSLSSYVNSTMQNPQQLAHIALKVSLVRAQYTKAYLIKVAKGFNKIKPSRDYQAIQDCLQEINDGVDQLTRSVKELQGIQKDDERDFAWHQGNVQTWTSTALTDALVCMDGFTGRVRMGGKMRAVVKAKVLNVAQVTSNALALFNRYVARRRASHHATRP